MKRRVVSVTEFMANCRSLLDEIGARGGTITITKRGLPLATVGPARRKASPERVWDGQAPIANDLANEETS